MDSSTWYERSDILQTLTVREVGLWAVPPWGQSVSISISPCSKPKGDSDDLSGFSTGTLRRRRRLDILLASIMPLWVILLRKQNHSGSVIRWVRVNNENILIRVGMDHFGSHWSFGSDRSGNWAQQSADDWAMTSIPRAPEHMSQKKYNYNCHGISIKILMYRRQRGHCQLISPILHWCTGCLCTEAAGSWPLLWLGKGLWNNLAIWHHSRPSQDWPQRQSAYFCVRRSKGPQNQSQNWDHTLWWILPRGRCSNWWCPCCDMLWSEDQWAALMYCEGHL